MRWLHHQCAVSDLVQGRWDEALEGEGAFIAECEAGSPHYLEAAARANRAVIREARGDVDGALADSRRAVDLARESGDPQEVLPQLGSAVDVLESTYAHEDARRTARADPGPWCRTPSRIEFIKPRGPPGRSRASRPVRGPRFPGTPARPPDPTPDP